MRYVDLIEFIAREHPEKEFATDGLRSVSYSEAIAVGHQVAGAQRDLGLGVGDRVAVLAENSIEYVLFYLGCAMSGCVPVPFNFRLAEAEWGYLLEDSESKMVVADPSYVPAIERLRVDLPRLESFITIGDPPNESSGWRSFDDLVGTAEPGGEQFLPPGSAMYQIYTSGTTGRPKGIVISHEAMTFQVMQQHASFGPIGVLDGRLLSSAPMFHAGMTTMWLIATTWGGSLYVQRGFEPVAALRALREEKITWALLVPAMISACLTELVRDPSQGVEDLGLIIYGSAPMPEPILREAIDIFGCEFIQFYGLSETNSLIGLQPADHRRALSERPELLRAAGRTVPGAAVRVVDEAGADVPIRQVGEILLAGPSIMSEYWKDPEKTAETIRDGWLWTGDAGYLDEEGYLYITDRIKDMVVSGAENIYPREVEEVLFTHPGIADVAVIGVPDERWGEALKAVVVRADGQQITAEDVIRYAKASLASYKCPKSVDFIDEMPRNPSGKVLKRELREPYWQHQERRV